MLLKTSSYFFAYDVLSSRNHSRIFVFNLQYVSFSPVYVPFNMWKNYSFKRSLLIWLIRKEVLNRILKDNLQKEYIYMVKPHLHLVKKTIVILISKHETLWFRKVVGVLNSFSKCLFWWIMDVHTHTYTTGGKKSITSIFLQKTYAHIHHQ